MFLMILKQGKNTLMLSRVDLSVLLNDYVSSV